MIETEDEFDAPELLDTAEINKGVNSNNNDSNSNTKNNKKEKETYSRNSNKSKNNKKSQSKNKAKKEDYDLDDEEENSSENINNNNEEEDSNEEENSDEENSQEENNNEENVENVNDNIDENTENKDEDKDAFNEKFKHSDELELEAINRKRTFFSIFTIYEIIMLILVVVFIINCFIGKSSNENMAEKWIKNNKDFFSANYAHIGINTGEEKDSVMMKESYNNYKFYASGRVHLNSTLVSLDFKKRQDLFTGITSVFFPERDRIVYEIALSTSNIPMVFCICKKKDTKYLRQTYSDLDHLTKIYEPSYLNISKTSKTLMLMSEDDQQTDKIFNEKRIYNAYVSLEKNIDMIYFTDQSTFSKDKQVLFCSFVVDSMEKGNEINSFVHAILDKISVVDYPAKKKQAALKRRSEYDEVVEKEKQKKLANSEEEIKKKEEDAKRKSESLSKKNYSKEQLLKMEEKEKKDRLKKQQKKQIKIMKQFF